jgi:dual specificity MAP kinase phosphatase
MAIQSIASHNSISIRQLSEDYVIIKNPHISEITPDVYLGSLIGAASLIEKNAHGFTHVLSCIEHELLPELPEGLGRLHIEISDEFGQSLEPHFETIIQFIDQAIATNGKIYVHCEMGKSRSAAAVIAYLMRSEGMSLKEAKMFVQEKRPVVAVNPWFSADLLNFHLNNHDESL